MSFMDKAKDLLNQHDDKVDQALDKAGEAAKGRFAGHDAHIDGVIDQAQQRTGAGDTTRPTDTGPGVAGGGPAEEQQHEPQHGDQQHGDQQFGDQQFGDRGGATEHAPEVPGHVPPQQ